MPPTPSPPFPFGETLASIPPGPVPVPRALATPNEAVSPTAEIAAPAPQRRGVFAILGVLSVVLIVVIMRGSGDRVSSDSRSDASVAADAAKVVDAPLNAVAVDAPTTADAGAVDHDAGPVEQRRDAGQDRRDAGQIDPPRDAGAPVRRDAGAKPDAGAIPPPDAAPPDAAAAGSNDLDIDETNPLKR